MAFSVIVEQAADNDVGPDTVFSIYMRAWLEETRTRAGRGSACCLISGFLLVLKDCHLNRRITRIPRMSLRSGSLQICVVCHCRFLFYISTRFASTLGVVPNVMVYPDGRLQCRILCSILCGTTGIMCMYGHAPPTCFSEMLLQVRLHSISSKACSSDLHSTPVHMM